jgi:hypothetical protein
MGTSPLAGAFDGLHYLMAGVMITAYRKLDQRRIPDAQHAARHLRLLRIHRRPNLLAVWFGYTISAAASQAR